MLLTRRRYRKKKAAAVYIQKCERGRSGRIKTIMVRSMRDAQRPPEPELSLDQQHALEELSRRAMAWRNDAPIHTWSCADVTVWLREALGLPEAAASFEMFDVTGEMMHVLTDEDLERDLRVKLPLDRQLILICIRKRIQMEVKGKRARARGVMRGRKLAAKWAAGEPFLHWDAVDVAWWMREELGLQEYADAFEEADVDGELLAELTHDELEELGVLNDLDRTLILLHIQTMHIHLPPELRTELDGQQRLNSDQSHVTAERLQAFGGPQQEGDTSGTLQQFLDRSLKLSTTPIADALRWTDHGELARSYSMVGGEMTMAAGRVSARPAPPRRSRSSGHCQRSCITAASTLF